MRGSGLSISQMHGTLLAHPLLAREFGAFEVRILIEHLKENV
jgi:hypothetical protein